jgi:hypothetical protein
LILENTGRNKREFKSTKFKIVGSSNKHLAMSFKYYHQIELAKHHLGVHKSTPSKQHQQRHWSRAKKFILASLITTTILVAVITTLAFTGVISASKEVEFPPDFSAALKEFYVATNGDSWLRKDNWLDEQKSIC